MWRSHASSASGARARTVSSPAARNGHGVRPRLPPEHRRLRRRGAPRPPRPTAPRSATSSTPAPGHGPSAQPEAGHRQGRRHGRHLVRQDRRPRRPLLERRLRENRAPDTRRPVRGRDPYRAAARPVDHRRRHPEGAHGAGGGGREGRRRPGPAGAPAVGPARHQGGQGAPEVAGQQQGHRRRHRHRRRRHAPRHRAELRPRGVRQLRVRQGRTRTDGAWRPDRRESPHGTHVAGEIAGARTASASPVSRRV